MEEILFTFEQDKPSKNPQLIILARMIQELSYESSKQLEIIEWAAPIPYFGDPSKASIATVGLNPSNREFVSSDGLELMENDRRFHTLNSLSIKNWKNLTETQLGLIHNSCTEYFFRNPYDGWFKPLDLLLKGTNDSFYSSLFHACHLDLIPYATAKKWAFLTSKQREILIRISAEFLGEVLKYSPIKILILNGKTVIESFEKATQTVFVKETVEDWALPRKTGIEIKGFSYQGKISKISGIDIGRDVHILGYNHNIQSSYGVTSSVRSSIQEWITSKAREILK